MHLHIYLEAKMNLPNTEKSKTKSRTKDEIRASNQRLYGAQRSCLKPLGPPVPGAIPPADIKITLMEIVKQFREILGKRDNRIGREFNHVLSLKTDEEIVDKILSLSNAEVLKDLQRLVDGRGYSWDEFTTRYADVRYSDEMGIYMLACGWDSETLRFVGATSKSGYADAIYIGFANNFRLRYTYHRNLPTRLEDIATDMFLKDVLGLNRFKNHRHYIALLTTSREHLLNDKFCQSLQQGLHMENLNKKRFKKVSAQGEAISYFLKTAEAIFIALFWSCQTEKWYNNRLRNCMPFADPVIGLNIRPSLHMGEVASYSNYLQDPRPEEKQELFQSQSLKRLLQRAEKIVKEVRRRGSIVNLIENIESKTERENLKKRFNFLAKDFTISNSSNMD